MKKEELFYFRAGACLAAIDTKNTARDLLSHQVKLRYPKGRKPTPEEYQAITKELKSVRLGIEKRDENILAYKIRKQKECRSLISKTTNEFPEFRHVLYSMVKQRSIVVGNQKLEIQRLQSKLRRAIYELITPYKENCISDCEVYCEILFDLPKIEKLQQSKSKITISLTMVELMEKYHNEDYEELVEFILKEIEPFYNESSERIEILDIPVDSLPYFVSTKVIDRFKKSFCYEDKSKALNRLYEKQSIRMQRFMKAYTELQNALK